MGKLALTQDGERYELDEFYKSLLFQHIMDLKLPPVETSFCMVLLRQTLHYGKWHDFLAISRIAREIGTAPARARKIISSLEEKEIITVGRSNGGGTKSPHRFHEFEFSDKLIFEVFDKWLTCKEDLGVY